MILKCFQHCLLDAELTEFISEYSLLDYILVDLIRLERSNIKIQLNIILNIAQKEYRIFLEKSPIVIGLYNCIK